jgi:quercetin dioxygenase-like cupin family protein
VKTSLFLSLCVISSTVSPTLAHEETKVAPLLEKSLPGIPGKAGSVLLVEYPPGGADPVHRHNASVFVYVLEGEIVMQVRGGKEVHYKPGDTFYEGPNDIHLVGRNASSEKPAKFLAFFVKDTKNPFVFPAK